MKELVQFLNKFSEENDITVSAVWEMKANSGYNPILMIFLNTHCVIEIQYTSTLQYTGTTIHNVGNFDSRSLMKLDHYINQNKDSFI